MQKNRIARKVIFQRVYEALGLENAVDTPGGGFYVSAAPLSMQTFEYFESLGIELQGGTDIQGDHGGFGLSHNKNYVTVKTPDTKMQLSI